MSMLGSQCDELRTLASGLEQFIADYDGFTRGEHVVLVASTDTMREAADTIDALVTALEDVLRNADDTVWVGKDATVGEQETLVDRMVTLGIYGQEVYEGARPWEVDA